MATEATELEPVHAEHGAHHTSTGLDNRKLAMWGFLGSECLLFGALISTYLLLPQPRRRSDTRTRSTTSRTRRSARSCC